MRRAALPLVLALAAFPAAAQVTSSSAVATGTSGGVVCMLSDNCTVSGMWTAPTNGAPLDSSTQIATDAFVQSALAAVPVPIPYAYAVGSPNSRSVSLATAYQATNTAKPAVVNVNLTSTATLSLSGGTTNTATVVIGATNAVASGTGTVICNYNNSSTGSLTIGLNTATVQATTCSFALPIGWYFAVRQIAGTVTITSVFDQAAG